MDQAKTRTVEMISAFNNAGIEISEEKAEILIKLGDYMLEYNQKVNLTAIKQWDDVVYKHFMDSILPLKLYEFLENAKVIDVGAGAGFPSLPMNIYRNDLNFTLLESIGKKTKYLESITNHIGLKCSIVNMRCEEHAHNANGREQFDVAIARAVAAFNVLAEYMLPFVKVGGVMLAMKSDGEEINEPKEISLLGGRLEDIIDYNLPLGDKRRLVVVKKISHTDTKYPRNSAAIAKKPL